MHQIVRKDRQIQGQIENVRHHRESVRFINRFESQSLIGFAQR